MVAYLIHPCNGCYLYIAALVKSQKYCQPPYEKIGHQCLYFSRPYEPWGVSGTWEQVDIDMYVCCNV